MLEQPNRIRYEHDYWNVINPAHNNYKKEMWDGLASIFLSPAHYTEYQRIHPSFDFKEVIFQPSPIDIDMFHAKSKKPLCIYVGAIEPHKGVIEAAHWAWERNIKLVVYGVGASKYFKDVLGHPAVIYGGCLGYADVADKMAEADMVIHLPVWVEPYGRTAVEARLAGCKLVTNDKLGVTSYDWWGQEGFDIRQHVGKQAKEFWRTIDRL